MIRKYKELMRIWNEVEHDNPSKSTEWLMAMTVDIYNNTYPNDPADTSDLVDAMEHAVG